MAIIAVGQGNTCFCQCSNQDVILGLCLPIHLLLSTEFSLLLILLSNYGSRNNLSISDKSNSCRWGKYIGVGHWGDGPILLTPHIPSCTCDFTLQYSLSFRTVKYSPALAWKDGFSLFI